jgi:hypothetical protein
MRCGNAGPLIRMICPDAVMGLVGGVAWPGWRRRSNARRFRRFATARAAPNAASAYLGSSWAHPSPRFRPRILRQPPLATPVGHACPGG